MLKKPDLPKNGGRFFCQFKKKSDFCNRFSQKKHALSNVENIKKV